MTHLNLDVAQIEQDHKRGTRNFHRDRVGALLEAYRTTISQNRTLRRAQRRARALRARLRKAAGTLSLELEAANERTAQLVDELYPGSPIVATQEEAGVFFAKALARMGHECTAREVFFTQLLGRLSKGEHKHGDRSFERSPVEILGEMRDEALDLAGWGYILWKRIQFSIDQLRADLLQAPDDEASTARTLDVAGRLLTQAGYFKNRPPKLDDPHFLRGTIERLENVAAELRERDPEMLAAELVEPEPAPRQYKGPNPAAHAEAEARQRGVKPDICPDCGGFAFLGQVHICKDATP